MADVRSEAAIREASALGIDDAPDRIDTASIYLIEAALTPEQLHTLADELLADAVTEQATIGCAEQADDATIIEVHPLPGVMDPDAQAVMMAIHSMLGVEADVRTGRRYDMHGTTPAVARDIAQRAFANTVIHAIHDQPWHPPSFPHGSPSELKIITIPLRELDDAALMKMSREAHLFLSLEEMQAIQAEYRRLGRDPREIELETLAQTWSEHCVHKTLKATIRYRELPSTEFRVPSVGSLELETRNSELGTRFSLADRPGHEVHADGSVTIHNLLKSTVAAATHELMADGVDWCLSVFVDNAGVIAFDDDHAVCFKCETHNHPSAIEPYGGAATGIGGCIRDIMGTGLAARPIAATDVFCVAHPNLKDVPAGCLPPRRILSQVVAGVRDYGNRMGIPTLNGAVWFDNDYVGNPLVYCGVIGVMPRDKVRGEAQPGDRIIAMGGRTGRDGIHGATFSSAELTDTHADEFSHAVQIGNAVTQKMMLDAILEARDHASGTLYSAITDCGAGGFSSAVGEMGQSLGAIVDLDRAPLKYAGLSPTEIWISEAQERMVLAVPPGNLDVLQAICDKHGVEMCDLGVFGGEGNDNAELILRFERIEVGRLSMHFMHEGIPQSTREAVWVGGVGWEESSERPNVQTSTSVLQPHVSDVLLDLLSHPNIASKQWIIRQYDHEVQGRTVIKPLTGDVRTPGPSDAAVITPVFGSHRGLGIANGLATGLKDDPYLMALAAIDECVRNLVCVGADPSRIAILDNFCWPSCNDPANLGALVRAAEGCYDGAKAYRTPFVSGKDSLNNQFITEDGRTIRIPYTLLISGMGIVENINRCVTMDAKGGVEGKGGEGNLLVIVGETDARMGGSHFRMILNQKRGATGGGQGSDLPRVDLERGPRTAKAVATAITTGCVRSAHDCSEGGLLIAAAEMAFAGDLGLKLDLMMQPIAGEVDLLARCFAETPSRYLLEVERGRMDDLDRALRGVPFGVIGEFNDSGRFTLADGEIDLDIAELREAWLTGKC